MADIKQENEGDHVQEVTMEDATSAEPADDVWDETRLVEAMAQLQEMYRQVRQLRSTIPNLVAPFTIKQTSPEILHRKVAKSIASANEGVRNLKQLMEAESSRKILEHAKESRGRDPKGIKPYKITDHPDWYEGHS